MSHGTVSTVSVGGVTTKGTCVFRGNAQVFGGTHEHLIATGDAKILGNVSTHRVTMTGKSTISGNIYVYKAQLLRFLMIYRSLLFWRLKTSLMKYLSIANCVTTLKILRLTLHAKVLCGIARI